MDDLEIKTLLVDDDDIARNILQKYLEVEGNVRIIGSANSASLAMKAIEREEPDVIFLDINMPKEDGLQFAQRIKQLGVNSLIVFTTAYRNYALYAFELKPLDYLVKPFGQDDVSGVISKVADRLCNGSTKCQKTNGCLRIPGKIMLRALGGTFYVAQSDILYFRTNLGGLETIYVNGKIERLKMLMADIEEELNPNIFVRISRSVIINCNYLNRIDKKEKRCFLKYGNQEYSFELTKAKIKYFENLASIKLG